LRAAGETVIVALGDTYDARCSQLLALRDGEWQVQDLVQTENDA
jgi:hypothetical protein